MSPAVIAYLGAILIAMGSSLFGVGVARVFWADDLLAVREEKITWERMKSSMQRTIDAQRNTITSKDKLIDLLRSSM